MYEVQNNCLFVCLFLCNNVNVFNVFLLYVSISLKKKKNLTDQKFLNHSLYINLFYARPELISCHQT